MNHIGSTIDYCKGLQSWIKTTYNTYYVEDFMWGAVASGHRNYGVGNVYLPVYLPNLEELKKVQSFHIRLSRDGTWTAEKSTNICLMWIEL